MADPCESRKEIERTDPVRIVLVDLFYSWYELFKEESVKVKSVIAKAMEAKDEPAERLKESILELSGNSKGDINSRKFAKKLAYHKNRIEGGLRLERMGTSQGTTLWRIKKMKSAE